jgi:hypothetical protein
MGTVLNDVAADQVVVEPELDVGDVDGRRLRHQAVQ